MKLELGLAISNSPTKIPIMKELDLISNVNCKGKQVYEDDNSSNLTCQSSVNDVDYGDEEINFGGFDNNKKKKRGFNEVESCVKTLPLLLWGKHPSEDDKLPKRLCNSTFTVNKNESDSVVGWPPIKSYRKKVNEAYQQQQQQRNGGRGGGCGGLRAMYVKVQMEGFFITRKIDLKLYHSYEALICALLTMFGKEDDSVYDYELTYQDEDGDWLLAGDVPWRAFLESVQRLRLRRRED